MKEQDLGWLDHHAMQPFGPDRRLIHAVSNRSLPPSLFTRFFAMGDKDLALHHAHRMEVTAHPGTPCRVSLEDAKVGDTVLLLNYEHQPAESPYRSRHAIFVRRGVQQARPAVGEVPKVLRSRLISIRHFDHRHMMVDADAVPGTALQDAIARAFGDPSVSYLHLHYAKPGCFAASVQRA